MRERLICHVDAFTDRPFTGNSAGVVLGADGLSDETMQALARELRHSETAFVLSPKSPDHDVWIRYFTPTIEVPICGHATIAAHFARGTLLGARGASVQRTGAGLQQVRIEEVEGKLRVTLQQGRPTFEQPLASVHVARLGQALGLLPGELDDRLPIQVASTGHSKVMVPVTIDADRLDALTPDMTALAELSRQIGCNGYHVFRWLEKEGTADGRMFAPAIGIPEDPVTGNANGPLAAYLVHHQRLRGRGSVAMAAHQGRAMGRPGIVHVEVTLNTAGQPDSVSITGQAVMISSGRLLPA